MGIYGLITAKLPAWFVGKGYYAEGSQVRMLSALMIVPLPLAFCAGLTLGIIDSDLIWIGSAIEIVAIIAAAIVVSVTLKKIRKPIESAQIIQNSSQEQA
jgi:ABC-type bacteriocin/lantibiotic exporter with double-glycine peptidase domain